MNKDSIRTVKTAANNPIKIRTPTVKNTLNDDFTKAAINKRVSRLRARMMPHTRDPPPDVSVLRPANTYPTTPPPEFKMKTAKTIADDIARFLLMKIGRGVKSMFVANEKSASAQQNAATFSVFNLSLRPLPSIILEARKIPLDAKLTRFSMLTKLLSNIIGGSTTNIADRTKATKLSPATKKSVFAAPKL